MVFEMLVLMKIFLESEFREKILTAEIFVLDENVSKIIFALNSI